MRNYATYIMLALAASYPIVSTAVVSESICQGVTETQTDLNFALSTVKRSDLEKPDGELRFGNIAEVRGQQVDLVVKASNFSAKYKKNKVVNGKELGGLFGRIGLNTVEGQPHSGSGTFEFCFVAPDTNNKVKVDFFQWYVLYSMYY